MRGRQRRDGLVRAATTGSAFKCCWASRNQFKSQCPSVEALHVVASTSESGDYAPLIDEDDSLEAEDRRIECARERALRWAGKGEAGDVA